MPDDKDHLDVDLSFLDDDKPSTTASPLVETRYKWNWKSIAVVGTIAVAIGGILFANSNSTPPTTNTYAPSNNIGSPSSSDTTSGSAQSGESSTSGTPGVNVGQFRCSSEDSTQADRLAPTETKDGLASDQSALDARAAQLEQLKNQMESSQTNENSSQAEIDSYNELVESYNSQLGSYKSDATSLQSRLDQFNAEVDAHNTYLETHCVRNGQ